MNTPRLATLVALAFLPLPLNAQANWRILSPSTSPSTRELQTMAYDIVQNQVLLFGGWGSNNLGDTWLWSGTDWTQLSLASNPPARHMAAMASHGIGLILFGGFGSGDLSDTWEWSLGQWKPLQPTTVPPARSGHAMAYDLLRNRIVMFGGSGSTGFLSDTWEWDGANWNQLSPAASPSARMASAMAYDFVHKRVVLFGGGSGAASTLGDTWEWDGTNWTMRSPNTSPSPRWFHSMSFDALRSRTMVFGGDSISGRHGDTWEWDGSDWLQRQPSNSPGPRRWHVSAYDILREEVLLFGGDNGAQQADTWVYETPQPASYAPFGTGCAGNAGVTTLTVVDNDLPWIGSTLRIGLNNLPSSAVAFMVVGASKTVWGTRTLPFDLSVIGMSGCKLYTSPDVAVPLTTSGGSAIWSLPLPMVSSLIGLQFYNQVFVGAPGKNPLGLVLSNAAEGKIGVR